MANKDKAKKAAKSAKSVTGMGPAWHKAQREKAQAKAAMSPASTGGETVGKKVGAIKSAASSEAANPGVDTSRGSGMGTAVRHLNVLQFRSGGVGGYSKGKHAGGYDEARDISGVAKRGSSAGGRHAKGSSFAPSGWFRKAA